MTRQLILVSLLFLAIACKKEQDTTARNVPVQEGTTAFEAKTLQRLIPKEALEVSASGPAALREGAKTSQSAAITAQVPFEPNAGATWRDPNTGKTHLLALQLPGTPGRRVQWQSLGTGWEGTTALAMDRDYFYAVWKNAVYRIPKRTPNAWSLFLQNNGEYITGIQNSAFGIYAISGNKLFYFNQYGSPAPISAPPDALPGTSLMAGYTGKNVLHFKNNKREIWAYSNYLGGNSWKKLHTYTPDKFFQSMTANPSTKMLYLTDAVSLHEIHQINESGVRSVFSYHPYGWEDKLVVNYGYVWIMGKTLHQLNTMGSQKGQSAYNESGWEGLQKVCAAPELVFK